MSDYFGKETPKLGFGLMRLPRKGIITDVEQVKKMEAREARKDEREAEIKKSTSYYNTSGKPASLRDKANMVKMFNEKNNNNNK